MAKYSESDIVRGRRELANGAVAGYVNVDGQERWRIVSGASAGYLNSVRRKAGSPKKDISERAAMRAFNRYYNTKSYRTKRGKAIARTRDLCSDNQARNQTTTYRRSPHRWDYAGVDDGARCPPGHKITHKRQASPKQRAALAKGRAALKAKRAARKGGGDDCGFNDETKRCSKAAEGHEEWCTLGKKGRCIKSAQGKREAPKNPSNVARGKALMANLKATGRVGRGRKKKASPRPSSPISPASAHRLAAPSSASRVALAKVTVTKPAKKSRRTVSRVTRGARTKRSPLGKQGSACRGLSQPDCTKHPACNYAKGSSKGSGCRKKRD